VIEATTLSLRATRLLCFGAFFFLMPLPYFLVEFGRVPPARMFQLTAYLVALVVDEGGQGAVVPAMFLVGSQAVGYGMATYWISGLLMRPLAVVDPRVAGIAVFVLVAACVTAASLTQPYVTPFSVKASHGGLMDVFR